MGVTFEDGLVVGWVAGMLFALITVSLKRCFNSGGTIYIQSSSVGHVSAGSIESSLWAGQAAQVKLLAVDKNGEELANFHMNQRVHLDLSIDGAVQEIHLSSGDIKVERCGNIDTVRTSQGRIDIAKCQDVGTVRTSQGNITIGECQTVNSTRTSQGNVNVRSRSQNR